MSAGPHAGIHPPRPRLGWVGTGRMGFAMGERLARAGHDVAVYNRTRARAEPLAEVGARVVDTLADLAGLDVVFTMISTPADLVQVLTGPEGLLLGVRGPGILVDCSTVDAGTSAEVRDAAQRVGTVLLAAPVSGNAAVAAAGRLTMAVSGPRAAFDVVRPVLTDVVRAATYVGEGEVARLVKLAHNVFLGVVTQSLAEITVLAERGGVSRTAFLEFLNDSVMGSEFTRYKTPALVGLDLAPTFTTELLRKDFDLGLAAARALEVPMPVAALTHQIVQDAVGRGHRDDDFTALIVEVAAAAGVTLEPELHVSDGLEA